DRWLSGLKSAAAEGKVVAQGFHVSYWDSLGWIDRFATPAHNARQRELAALQGSRNVYTPQLVRDGRDTREYDAALRSRPEAAGAVIRLERIEGEATAEVTPSVPGAAWAAYWTVTEHAHASKVRSGENAGELLQHDFVVRQFVPVIAQQGTRKLSLRPLPPTPGPRGARHPVRTGGGTHRHRSAPWPAGSGGRPRRRAGGMRARRPSRAAGRRGRPACPRAAPGCARSRRARTPAARPGRVR